MPNESILDRVDSVEKAIESAMKAITVGDLGDSKVTPEKADRFIRRAQDSTPLLDRARRIEMNGSDERHIDRTGFTDRILHDPNESNANKTEDPTFHTNKLVAQEVQGISGIFDDSLEDNIEGENFEDTLIDLIGEQAGRDIEELGILGDTAGSGDPFLNNITDGWGEKAANQLDATANGSITESDPESVMQAAFDATPRRFINDRRNWMFFTSYDIEDAYRDVLKQRGTGLGDEAQTTGNMLRYKGFGVMAVGNMPSDQLIFTNPDNMVWGVRRDIRIEPDRIPKDRKTDFVVTLRLDYHYEDENGATRVVNSTA